MAWNVRQYRNELVYSATNLFSRVKSNDVLSPALRFEYWIRYLNSYVFCFNFLQIVSHICRDFQTNKAYHFWLDTSKFGLMFFSIFFVVTIIFRYIHLLIFYNNCYVENKLHASESKYTFETWLDVFL